MITLDWLFQSQAGIVAREFGSLRIGSRPAYSEFVRLTFENSKKRKKVGEKGRVHLLVW